MHAGTIQLTACLSNWPSIEALALKYTFCLGGGCKWCAADQHLFATMAMTWMMPVLTRQASAAGVSGVMLCACLPSMPCVWLLVACVDSGVEVDVKVVASQNSYPEPCFTKLPHAASYTGR
jgi:hypothetical protein